MTAPASKDAAAHPGDHWLDEVTAPSTPVYGPVTRLAMRTFSGPARLARRLYYFASTTPGKMFTVTVILTLALGAAGLSMSQSSASRHADLNELLSTTEPMSSAAHHLYTSLSLADTVATTGFVQAGLESKENRDRYNEAIDNASVAATESVLGTSNEDARIRELVMFIQRELPVYTAMVEKARANHRAGNAVATPYMSNASALMREEILPAASELFRLTTTKVNEQQQRLTSPQWVPLSGLFAALFFLLIAQYWLWRITRRKLNRGFVAASVMMCLAITWVSISNIATWSTGHQGFETASRPWDSLTASRIEAQQTRTSGTLALVLRASQQDMSAQFDDTMESINNALADYEAAIEDEDVPLSRPELIDDARYATEDWQAAHNKFMDALNAGSYDEAIEQATAMYTGDATPTAARAFERVDSSLADLISQARISMRSYLEQGLSAVTAVATAVFLLTLGAILAVWLGIRPRLQEYL
ncbi:MCP four helix bundle domain-containing protein [Corynebacterium camporealensis]